MKLIKAFFYGLATVFLLEFVFFSCESEPPPPLRVGFVVWPGSESMYLARDLGYYAKTPIKLVDYASDSELMRSYRNRDVEAAALTLDQTWSLAETAPDFRIVLIRDFSVRIQVIWKCLKCFSGNAFDENLDYSYYQ